MRGRYRTGTDVRAMSRWIRLPTQYGFLGKSIPIADRDRRKVEAAILSGGTVTTPHIEAVQVVPEGSRRFSVAVRGGLRACQKVEWQLEMDGGEARYRGTVRTAARACKRQTLGIRLPQPLHAGYWTLRLRFGRGRATCALAQTVIVSPPDCYMPQALDSRRILAVQLYSVRSKRNHGIGDFTDLGALMRMAGEAGFGFVALNPLHALNLARPAECSPYSPDSRKFLNPLYLDVEKIEGFGDPDGPAVWFATDRIAGRVAALTEIHWVDYSGVAALKLSVAVWAFARALEGGEGPYRRRFRAWLKREAMHALPFAARQPRLADLPILNEVAERLGVRRWGRRKQALFHLYLQHEAARQFEDVVAAVPIVGIVSDLAIGPSNTAADVVGRPELYCREMSLGSPPDALAPQGQCWQLPPYNPLALRRDGYRDWIATLRRSMPAGGAIRIDHVLGLMRQYWIPAGQGPDAGAYVGLPVREFMAVLAVESHRSRCIVAGEDLGVVPRGLRALLAKACILGFEVLQLNCMDPHGTIRRRRVIASLNTHDLPTFKAFWDGSDRALRVRLGLDRSDKDTALKASAARMNEKQRLLTLFNAEPDAGGLNDCDLDAGAALQSVFERLTEASGTDFFPMIMLDDLCA